MIIFHRVKRHISLFGMATLLTGAPIAHADPVPYTAVKLYSLDAPSGFTFQGPSSRVPMDTSGQAVGHGTIDEDNRQAILWRLGTSPISLHPTNLAGYDTSIGMGASGNQRVGYGSGTATGATSINSPKYQALLWNGLADTAVNLHPTNLSGFEQSQAHRTDGVRQVGLANFPVGTAHAMLWSGTAASAVDLHPGHWADYVQSFAHDVDGNKQVGVALNATPGNYPKPVLWSGTAASAIDLTPSHLPFFNNMVAFGVGGGQQVGYGQSSQPTIGTRAILWSGTAASAIDLTPDGSVHAIAVDTNGSKQVGYFGFDTGIPPPLPRAMVWSGTKESAVNLHALLWAGVGESWAYAINGANDIFGIARGASGYDAVQWIAAPHTASTNVSSGANQMTTVAGRSTDAGQVHVTFPQTTGGELTSINSLLTAAELASQSAAIDFALPSAAGLVQTWELTYGGSFNAPATLVFHYDPSLLTPGIDELSLQIEHFEGGQWTTLTGVVDPVLNTITVTTDSFSPFALSMVPEPASGLLGMAAGLVISTRRRRDQ